MILCLLNILERQTANYLEKRRGGLNFSATSLKVLKIKNKFFVTSILKQFLNQKIKFFIN